MKYRKKPVVIEASQWFKMGDHPNVHLVEDNIDGVGEKHIPWIDTLEGGHIVSVGDYIITGVKGECYPCKPDIFKITYTEDCMSGGEVDNAADYLAQCADKVTEYRVEIAALREVIAGDSDEIQSLRQQVAELKEGYAIVEQENKELHQVCDSQVIKIVELEADAKRYRWISVEDAMPEYSTTQKRVRVLVYWTQTKGVFTLWYGVRFGAYAPEFYEENEWTENNYGEIDETENQYLGECLTYKNITHWKPLPEPPMEKTK